MDFAPSHTKSKVQPAVTTEKNPFFSFGQDMPATVLPFFQPKLSINTPGDVYEQEADAMAEKVMSQESVLEKQPLVIDPVTPVQTKCAECEEDEEQVQKKEIETSDNSFEDDPSVHSENNTIDADPSAIHRASEPFISSASRNAFFSYNQNTSSSAPFFQPKLSINAPGDVYEQEADAMAEKIMSQEPVLEKQPPVIEPVAVVQTKCAECEEDEEQQVQKKEREDSGSSFDGDAQANPDDISNVINQSFIQRESFEADERYCTATLNWSLGCFFTANPETGEGWTSGRQTAFLRAAKPAIEEGINDSNYRIIPGNPTQTPGATREFLGGLGLMDPTIPCPCVNGFIPQVNLTATDQGVNGSADWHTFVYANTSGAPLQSDASGSSERFGHLDEMDVDRRGDIRQTPVVHEFGHSIGLHHPGAGIEGVNEYRYSGQDVHGRTVRGAIDLMGRGSGLRPFYFNRWRDQLNENFAGCNFSVSAASPEASRSTIDVPAGQAAATMQRKTSETIIQKQDDDPPQGISFNPLPPGITGRYPNFGFNLDVTNAQLDFGNPARRQLSLGLNLPGEPYAALTSGNFAFKLGYDFAANNLLLGGRYGGLSYGLLAGFQNPSFGLGIGYGHFPLFNYGMRSAFQFGNTPLPFEAGYRAELGNTQGALNNFQQGGSNLTERLFSVAGAAGNFASMTGDMYGVSNQPQYNWGIGVNAGYDPQLQWYFMLGAQFYLGRQEQRRPVSIDRKAASTNDEQMLQRKQSDNGTMEAPAFENYVNNLNGSGSSLPPASKQFFESRFGTDFSGVKVHTDSTASNSAASINALAYTAGSNIVFNQGQYAPGTPGGDKLLAHELTHVIQQSNGLKRIARATYTVGNSRVNIDYGNVVFHDNILEYDTEIESRYTGFTGRPATTILAAVTVLTNSQKRWLLYAIDLLTDNPIASLNKVQAVQRLIDYVPNSINRPLDGTPPGRGYFKYENEVLRVSGWFEKALTAGLAAPSADEQRLLNFALNNATSGSQRSAGSSCPVRTGSDVLNETDLRADLPPLMNTYLQSQVSALNGRGIQSQNITDIVPIADVVQREALRFFAPYIGNSSSRTFLQTWRYSSHLTASTAPNAIPADALRAFLSNRARGRANDSGLFGRVHYDSRCDADVVVFNDLIDQLMANTTVQSQLAAILSWQSFTGHGETSADTVINLQFFSNQNECESRWRTVNTLCHEIVHPYVHSSFYALNRGRRIITEGFTEILGDQLYTEIRRRATANPSFRAGFEGGLTAGVCSGVTIPDAETNYGDDGEYANRIRGIVGDDRFRAAYFLGQTTLAGLQPKLAINEPGDEYEQEADAMADRVMRMVDAEPVQLKCAACQEEEKVQRKENAQSDIDPETAIYRKCPQCEEEKQIQKKESGPALPIVSAVDQTLQSASKPMDGQAKEFMEQRFGQDFSSVQIHDDTTAHQSAAGINALAYTHQNHIAFGEGQYQPETNAGKKLLAHELTHVVQQQASKSSPATIQRDVTPSAAHYFTFNHLLPKTISQFFAYINTQADWFSEPSLSEDQREEIEYLIFFANNDVQAVFGNKTVSQFRVLFNTDGALADERRSRLMAYAAAASARKYPFEISDFAANLTQAIGIGADILHLLEGFPAYVLHTAMKEDEFKELRTHSFISDLLAYYTTARQRPTFEADNGKDFASFTLFRLGGTSPLHYDSTALVNRIRNYHRFEKTALDRLVTNFGNTSKSLPLTLILHTALDHNGAFHRDPNLTAVVTNNSMLTLMIEGFETLADIQALIGPLATAYGVNNKINQLMFAGHGNARIIQMAGTTEEQVTDTGEHSLAERTDSLSLDANAERTERLINEVLAYMDNDSTDPAASQPNTRVVFNACLTGSNSVREAIAEGDLEAARTHVRDYINANASLATFLDNYAASHNAAGLTSIGSNASFGQIGLINSQNELDIISAADPAITASKLQYVETGTETAGALRAVLESFAINVANTLDAMRRRLAITESNNWDVLLIRKAYQIILAGFTSNVEKIRLTGAASEPLAELKFEANCNISKGDRQTANAYSASANTDDFFADLISAVTIATQFTGRLRIRLSILQLWLMKAAAKDADFMTALAGSNANFALNFTDINFLEDNNGTLTRLFTSTNNDAKLRLALIGVLGFNSNERCKNYLISLLAGSTTFPASLHVDAALGGAASQAEVIDTLGINATPSSASATTGSATPPVVTHTANIRLHGQTGNTVFINPIHQYSEFIGYLVIFLREGPDASSRFVGDASGERNFYVLGETGDWYAVQHLYEGETIPSVAFIRKRTGAHSYVRNLND